MKVLLLAPLALAVLVGLVLPYVLPGVVERGARERGVPLTVDGARIDWLSGRVVFTGARLGDPWAPAVSWREVEVELAVADLLDGDVTARRMRVRGVAVSPDALAALSSGGDVISWLGRIGSIDLESLDLPGVADALGADAVIDSATCRDLAALAAGGEARCDLGARLGTAGVRLSATFAVEAGALRIGAVAEGAGFELHRWQVLAGGGVLEQGVARGVADLEGRYDGRAGVLAVAGEVSLEADGVRLALAGGTVDAGTLSWRGRLDSTWSIASGHRRSAADGELGAPTIAFRRSDGTLLELEDVDWRGTLGAGAGVALVDGTLDAARLSLTAPGVVGELARVAVRATSRGSDAPGAFPIAVEEARVGAGVVQATALGELEGLRFDDLSVATLGPHEGGGLYAASVTIGTVTSTGVVVDAEGERARLRAPDLVMIGASLDADARLEVERLVARAVEVAGDGWGARAREATADRITGTLAGELAAGKLALARLDLERGEDELSGERLALSDAAATVDGSLSGRHGTAAEIRHRRGGRGQWVARDLVVNEAERRGDGGVELGALALASFDLSPQGEATIRVEGSTAEAVRLAPDGSLGAGAVAASAIELDRPGADNWRLDEAGGTGLTIGAQGSLAAERLAARRVRLRRTELESRVDELSLEAVQGASLGQLVAARASLSLLDVRLRSGEHWRISTVDARTVTAERLERFAMSEARVARLAVSEESGRSLDATGVRMTGYEWRPPGAMTAAAIDLDAMSGGHPDGLAWQSIAVSTRGIAWDQALHVLDSATAAAERFEVRRATGWQLAIASPTTESMRWSPGGLPGARLVGSGPVTGAMGGARWRLRSSRFEGGDPARLHYERAVLEGFAFRDPASGGDLTAARVRLADVSLSEGPTIDAERFDLDALHVGSGDQAGIGHLDAIWAHGSGVRAVPGEEIGVEVLRLSGLDIGVGVAADGTRVWPLADPREVTEVPRRVRLDSVSTEGHASISFADLSHAPPVRSQFPEVNAVLAGFDTARPAEPASFEIRAAGDSATTLTLRGAVAPALGDLDTTLNGSVRALELAALSPWSSRYQGVAVLTGRADVDIDARIVDRQVDGVATIALHGARIGVAPSASDAQARRVADLIQALSLLEDQRGEVRLNVPFAGSLEDPDFRVAGAVARGFANAATAAVLLALKPVGLLVGVLDRLNGARFEPVVFRPGEVALRGESIVKLDEIARTLGQRPRMRIDLCGQSVPDDAQVLRAAFSHPGRAPPTLLGGAGVTPSHTPLSLARSRADAVRSYLVGRPGVSPGQLGACAARVDADQGARPRVDILLEGDQPRRRARGPASRQQFERVLGGR